MLEDCREPGSCLGALHAPSRAAQGPTKEAGAPDEPSGEYCNSVAQLLRHTRYHMWLAQKVGIWRSDGIRLGRRFSLGLRWGFVTGKHYCGHQTLVGTPLHLFAPYWNDPPIMCVAASERWLLAAERMTGDMPCWLR